MSMTMLKRFFQSEAGNYATIFALTIFPILGTVGLAIDYANIERHRSAVQNSLDAAALAAGREYSHGVTGDALLDYARDFFASNLPPFIDPDKIGLSVALLDENIVDKNGEPAIVKTVKLDADLEYDSFLAGIFGHDRFDVGIASQVALGNITVEIAMVMDNSGSMGSHGKINLAKSTAKNLVDTIYQAASNSNKPNPVSFSLVPFAGMVNIGPQNAGEDWMDTNGWSPIHHENLNWKTYVTKNPTEFNGAGFREKVNNVWQWKSRFDLYDAMNIDWLGCVEMRPWPHNTQDTASTTGSASPGITQVTQNSAENDRAALFVPLFAPDEPDRTYAYKQGNKVKHANDWYNYGNDYAYDWARPKQNNPSQNEQLYYNDPDYSPFSFGVFDYLLGVVQSKQNARQDWVWRYQADSFGSGESGSSKGPNYGCTSMPVTPLTTTKSTIKSSIDQMVANGMTNIQQGLAWGWRTLTPKKPFTGGRDSADETNRKYMIVLTDGNNTYNSSSTPNETYFGAWGYGKHNRIENGLSGTDLSGTPYVGQNLNTFEKKMNAHTVQTCNNAKADGVTIFTIAFDVDDGSSVKAMLDACAGSGIVNNKLVMKTGQFYFDVEGSELEAAMASIANQISEMRIMR